MPSIVTSRTRDLYQRPPQGPFVLNYGSPLAVGLGLWMPMGEPSPRVYQDYARGFAFGPVNNPVSSPALYGGLGGLFASASSQYLECNATVVSAAPCTLACWFTPTTLTSARFMSFTNTASAITNGFSLEGVNTGAVIARTGDGSGTTAATTATTVALGIPRLAVARFNSPTSRDAILFSGGIYNKANDTGNRAPSGINVADIATVRTSAAPSVFANGLISDACVWPGRALSDAEIFLLFDPKARWDLYYPLNKRAYSFPPTTAAPSTTGTPILRGGILQSPLIGAGGLVA